LEVVLGDRPSAVSLMEHLSRYRSFLVEPDRQHWLVFARCQDQEVWEELLERIDAWAAARGHPSPRVHVRSDGRSARQEFSVP
jgi:hypothetical protein